MDYFRIVGVGLHNEAWNKKGSKRKEGGQPHCEAQHKADRLLKGTAGFFFMTISCLFHSPVARNKNRGTHAKTHTKNLIYTDK